MKYNGGRKPYPLYYPFYRISLNIPQSYDDTLTYYESIARLNKALHDLVDELNDNWSEMASERLDKWIGDYLEGNIEYTEEDKGVHFNFNTAYISGDHIYDEETETMKIVGDDDNGEHFKI